MSTNIFLGYPPENIKQFIIDNYGEVEQAESIAYYKNGQTRTESITNFNNMSFISDGILNRHDIIKIELGSSVTSIGMNACSNISGDLIIPKTVLEIDLYAFMDYSGTVIFKDRTIEEVQSMEYYPWMHSNTSKIKVS